ncbi:uncharacterized protein LOC111062986 isoform X2 [Nilaparvata lugens]|uniref:uncharacterized protein LOC111062986 isoform X2 n=1 Tax=Nilaparvata lugens TaxID=108931 RepID=UPI00193DE328|nr:uncharacterized protein LOC111062986 isoform X2 [Nilaparvata lugens]
MIFCVYLQTIIFYMVFVTVTGNKCDKLSPGSLVDYPYIIYDTTDDWESALFKIVTELNTNDNEINRIVQHGELCNSIDTDTAKLLRRMIIQHCVSLDIINSFGKEEKSLMRDAIKKGMETCKTRIKSSDSDFNTDESEAAEHQCRFVAAVKHILLEKQKNARFSRPANYMIENFKYASRNFEMEYMFLSLSDSRIANFFMKLFLEIDKLSPQTRLSIILSITNTEFLFRPEEHPCTVRTFSRK